MKNGNGQGADRGRAGLGYCLAAGVAEMAGLFALMTAIVAGFGAGAWSQVTVMAAYPVSLGFALWPLYSQQARSRSEAIRMFSVVLVVGLVVAVLYYDTAAAGLATGEVERILGAGLLTLVGGLGWWLGATVAQSITHPRAVTRFQAAILLLLLLSPVGAEPVGIAALFFVASATALALSRWETGAGGVLGVLRRAVAPGAAAGVALVTLLTLTVAVAFSPSVAGAILGGLGAAADRIRLGETPQFGGEPVHFRLSCDLQFEGEEMPLPGEPPEGGPGEPSAAMLWIVSGVIVAAVITGLVIAIIKLRDRVVKRGRQRPQVVYVEHRASLLAELKRLAGALAASIKDAYRRIRAWRPWRRQGAGTPSDPGTLRALYRVLLDRAAQAGLPRQPWQTPLEYLDILGQAIPNAEKALQTVTRGYVAARYGPETVPQAMVEAARSAWVELEPLIGERQRPGRKAT